MGLLSEMGVDTSTEEMSSAQKVVSGGIIPPGVYKMQIERAFISKSSGGAAKANVDFIYKKENGEDGKFFYGQYISSGDEKGNKTTYTDKTTGQERTLPGMIDFNHLLQAAGQPDPEVKKATIEMFNEQVEVKALPTLTGVELTVGLRGEYDDYKEKDVNFAEAFLDKDGKNSEGTDLLEVLTEKIKKAPMKKPKAKKASKTSTTTTASEDSPW